METKQTPTITIFSVFSGTFYEVPESDFGILDIGQIPLAKKPSKCSKCFNRGYVGRDNKTFVYAICSCLHKAVDHDRIRNAKNITVG